MHRESRRGFLRATLGAAWTGAALLEQAVFRAARARAQARAALPVLFDIQKLADGVYAALAKPQTILNCNAVIFENASDLLIVDAHSKPSAVASLVRQIRDQWSKKPVGYVVASHFHWDHAQGTPAYRRIAPHARLVSSETTRGLISRLSAKRLADSVDPLQKSLEEYRQKAAAARTAQDKAAFERMARETREYLDEMRNFQPELPDMTLTHELVLHDKAHDLRVMFRGRGHTAGDVIVHCPQKRVVATGDLAHSFAPFIGDGYPLEWPGTLLRIAELEFAHVAGGHGDPHQGNGRLYQMANYIEEITEAVVKGRRDGKGLDRLKSEIAPATLRSVADGGYGRFVAESNLKWRMIAPPQPPAEEVLADAVRSNVEQIYAALDRS